MIKNHVNEVIMKAKQKLTPQEKIVKSLSKTYGIDLLTPYQWYSRRMSCNLHRDCNPNSKFNLIPEIITKGK